MHICNRKIKLVSRCASVETTGDTSFIYGDRATIMKAVAPDDSCNTAKLSSYKLIQEDLRNLPSSETIASTSEMLRLGLLITIS